MGKIPFRRTSQACWWDALVCSVLFTPTPSGQSHMAMPFTLRLPSLWFPYGSPVALLSHPSGLPVATLSHPPFRALSLRAVFKEPDFFLSRTALKDRPLVPRLGLGSPSWWNQSWFYNPL